MIGRTMAGQARTMGGQHPSPCCTYPDGHGQPSIEAVRLSGSAVARFLSGLASRDSLFHHVRDPGEVEGRFLYTSKGVHLESDALTVGYRVAETPPVPTASKYRSAARARQVPSPLMNPTTINAGKYEQLIPPQEVRPIQRHLEIAINARDVEARELGLPKPTANRASGVFVRQVSRLTIELGRANHGRPTRFAAHHGRRLLPRTHAECCGHQNFDHLLVLPTPLPAKPVSQRKAIGSLSGGGLCGGHRPRKLSRQRNFQS